MILQLQWAQVGAIAWIAHSKLSKVMVLPAWVIWKALSYSLPQTSHVGMGFLRAALPERRDQRRVLFDNGSRWRWFRRRNGNFALDRAAFPDHRKRPEKQGSNAQ